MERGIVAPKDPIKKGPYFYIMQDKAIFAAPTKADTGVTYIYQNDNRLVNSAKIAGNVTNEEILNLLKTTGGFRRLVSAIGVSILGPSAKENVKFVYQMYGKKDTYNSGTSIELNLLADGAEQLIDLSKVDWSEDDLEPGQIRIEYEKPKILVSLTVRFYLNEGFSAPEAIEDFPIDEESPEYKSMIKKSLMQLGNPQRLKKAISKAKNGEAVTISFIGGSITQGAGAVPINENCYAHKMYEGFKNKYGKRDNIQFIKAGVGGTPSELGMIRFERDVLRGGTSKPDIIVIEFAVNDEGDETKGDSYESLVRKCLMLPNKPAVILLFAVFSYDWNLQDRLSIIGRNLDLSMVSIMDAVTPQFRLKKGEGRVLSKNQFFYDVYHPSNNGHKIMANCLLNLIDEIDRANEVKDMTDVLLLEAPSIGKTFERVKLLDKNDIYVSSKIVPGDFDTTDTELQCVEMDMDLKGTQEFPYNWHYDGSKTNPKAFKMTITCKALLIISKDSGANDFGRAKVFVDEKEVLVMDPHKNGWIHCNAQIILNEKETKAHEIKVEMLEEDKNKKFTVLGFGYVE